MARTERAPGEASAGRRAGGTRPAGRPRGARTGGKLHPHDHAEWNRHARGESDVQRVDLFAMLWFVVPLRHRAIGQEDADPG